MNYTDAQLQAAIDAAFPAGKRYDDRPLEATSMRSPYWQFEAPNRLAIAQAFLDELGKIKPATTEGAPATSEPDPYARLKAYAAAGARIRCFGDVTQSWGVWNTGLVWDWCLPTDQYEVHPDDLHLVSEYAPKNPDAQENWNQYADKAEKVGVDCGEIHPDDLALIPEEPAWTLPPPPEGHKWHRNDWTQDMLPEGYRPLLDGEVIEEDDEFFAASNEPQEWKSYPLPDEDDDGTNESIGHLCTGLLLFQHRTRRPLPSWSQASAELIQKAEAAGIDLDAQTEEPAWIQHDGKGCPLKDEEVEEWEVKWSDKEVRSYAQPPSTFHWEDDFDKKATVIAYRVLKWKPGYGPKAETKPATFEAHGKTWTRHKPGDPMPCDPEALLEVLWQDDIDGIDSSDVQGAAKNWDWSNSGGKYNIIGWRYADEQPEQELEGGAWIDPVCGCLRSPDCKNEPCPEHGTPSQSYQPSPGDVVRLKSGGPEMALGGQMYWRDLALQLADVWWKCYGIGASLQHGDLNKDVSFSIVCERHGGQVFHAETPQDAWSKAEQWLLSTDRENFPTACLQPVTK